MISATTVLPFLLLGALIAALMQYGLSVPPHISLVLVVPALALGLVVTYAISFVTGIPIWYIVVSLCVAIVGVALLTE